MMSIRAFLAAEIDEEMIHSLAMVQADLISHGASVRWVKPENIHLTLHFFGNIREEEVEDICREMCRVSSAIKPMTVQIEGLGAFPSLNNPKVIWAGITDAEGRLVDMQGAVARELARMGYKVETRPFHPHLTLGRLRSAAGKSGLREALKQGKIKNFGDWNVKGITLFRSDLKPSGAQYTRLRVIPLHGDS
ncbi:MAG: RNA 2',3'-cyclic phosphodiesterase [Deltaproteobacteria bacterium]|nr:RNA 2',3'-cyclic phosphodiesterase [Deltaproteobacteria bacterium]MBW2307302.1 RNA 2',3'-cyclic phosphodiesterase [Deltaproteobacteria bacterium]